ATVTVTVDQKSGDPTSATATPAIICNGQSSAFSLQGGGGGDNETIHWYTSSCGGTSVGTGNGLSVSPTVTTTYYGRYEDGAPCSYSSGCATVTVTVDQKSADPTSATAIPAVICYGQSSVLSLQGGGGGNNETIHWYTSSCGGTSVGTGNGLSVSPTATTTYYGRYEDGSPCNYNSACAQVIITVNPLPVPTITGPSPICNHTTGNVYTTEPGMTNYQWVVSSGGNIEAGGTLTSNSVTVTWNSPGAQFVSVNYTDNNGCTAVVSTVKNITVNPLPVPTITGPLTACQGNPGNVYTTQAGMTMYYWTVSPGGIVIAGGTPFSNTITVTWTFTGSNVVMVNYTDPNGCTAQNPAVYPVNVTPAPVATISGTDTLCINSGFYNYITESGKTNYTWSISSGGTITWGQGTDQIQVLWNNAGPQWVNVIYTDPSGCSPVIPTVFNIQVNDIPEAAGIIQGASSVCQSSQGIVYSVNPVGNAVTYVWSLPVGASIVSGGGTNSITVDFASNASSGPVTVYGNNLCGNGAISPALMVNVDILPTDAGPITGQAAVCEGSTEVSYYVSPVPNASGYVWTLPPGASISSGFNSNSILVDFSDTASSGIITVAGTNSCGQGMVSPSFNVTVNPIPAAPVIYEQNDTLISSVDVGNQWYYEKNIIPGANGKIYVATQTGNYEATVTINGCTSLPSNSLYVVITGTRNENNNMNITVYPNPGDGLFTVSITTSKKEDCSYSVFNNLGIKVYERSGFEVQKIFKEKLDLSALPNGVYSIVFSHGKKNTIFKVVINK
ncbi:MAG: T9SS type A sorting domain-containing protein, partial [Bacteroidota bacterium]|nr:T9SS type A sorting domain-containing protein [Bacteroidota bacterium]